MFQRYFQEVPGEFQECFKGVKKNAQFCFKSISKVHPGSFNFVSKKFWKCFTEVLKLQMYFWNASNKFQGGLRVLKQVCSQAHL